MVSKDVSKFIPKRSTIEPDFGDEGKMAAFHAANTPSMARKLIALGYGPKGAQDENYNPVYRHRYYLTVESLHTDLDALVKNPKGSDIVNVHTLLDDIKWFIKSRNDVQEAKRT